MHHILIMQHLATQILVLITYRRYLQRMDEKKYYFLDYITVIDHQKNLKFTFFLIIFQLVLK